MAKRRKVVHMLVAVSVPLDMTAAEARREVRALINDQCNWAREPGDVKARHIAAAPRSLAHD